MNKPALATNLLGCPVRLRERPAGRPTDTGQVATVFLGGRGVHHVLLLGGRLIQLDEPAAFTVLDGGA